jgi:phosphate transport system substrate-binding protein
VASDKFGIGYSGIGYKTADVRAVALSKSGDQYVEAIPENAYSGNYPLSRFLLLGVNYRPGSELDPLRREFIKFVYSKQGQEAVIKDGYFPVNAVIARKMLASIGIDSEL